MPSFHEAVSRGQIAAKVAKMLRLMLRRSDWHVTGATPVEGRCDVLPLRENKESRTQHCVSFRLVCHGEEISFGVWEYSLKTKRRLRVLWLTGSAAIGACETIRD